MTQRWMDGVLDRLARIQPEAEQPASQFLNTFYRTNQPITFQFGENWPATRWTIDRLRHLIGDETRVEVQVDRSRDPLYELRSADHRCKIRFKDFVRAMEYGPENDVYMTAQNSATNAEALAPVWRDVGPLPEFLRPNPAAGFFWLGSTTTTPLHHDETNNVLLQVMGTKLVRMFPPGQRDKLSPGPGVHSELGWVDDDVIEARGLEHQDVMLSPGRALFLPIGWWHCIRSVGMACTIVYTNFIWENFFGRVTD